jgi:lambda repressor-like predicted transcriptional regulator
LTLELHGFNVGPKRRFSRQKKRQKPKQGVSEMFNKRPPKNPELRWIWTMAMLRARGTSFAEIARELNLPRREVLHVKTRIRPRIEQAVAEKLGLQAADIWPERYPVDADNKRRGRGVQ